VPSFRANVRVVVKPTINDPEGLTIANALRTLGFDTVESVRAGKYLQVTLEAASRSNAEAQAREMCEKLLANPVIEQFDFDIDEL
jgi:phosphoribosylformylglycinamidine synthase